MYRNKLIWSIAGLSSPVVCAAFCIPLLLGRIGTERFGILALAWALLASASVLDLGIGRATTQYLSALRGRNQLEQAPATVHVALRLSLSYSLAGSLLLILAVAFDAHTLIRHQGVGEQELQTATLIIIAVLPIQVLTALYRGICEAFEDFRSTALVRLYLGISNFIGPVLVSFHTRSLVALSAALLAGRLLGLLMQYASARRHLHAIRRASLPAAALEPNEPWTGTASFAQIRRQLNRFGQWMTISNIAHPLLMQSDRFVIAGTISAAAVTSYYVPMEVVLQSTILASSVASVMLPMLTASLQQTPGAAHRLFVRWRNRLLLVALLAYIALAFLFPLILRLWMGERIDPESARLGQIMCAGAFFYSISVIYTAYLQAQGRVRGIALLKLTELVLYLPGIYLAARHFGLTGASCAWVLRSLIDAMALACLSRSRKAPSS